ncbi:hypothetical protein FJZ17_00910 [Candidatus Pacearchaeota archaeon]|nr:hypothetical protein [Candidatus Pacearchaeota archaeon]
MEKRAQITLFVILGIVIVTIILLFFYFKSNNLLFNDSIPPEVQPTYDFIIDCIEKISYQGFYNMAKVGGNYPLDTFFSEQNIPLYLENNISLAPKIKDLNSVYNNYLNFNLQSCLKNLRNTSNLNISYGNFSSSLFIKEEKILIRPEFPIMILRDERILKLIISKEIYLTTNFGKLYYISLNITEDYKNGGGFKMDSIMNNFKSSGVITSINQYPDYTQVSLIDERGIKNESVLTYSFLLK